MKKNIKIGWIGRQGAFKNNFEKILTTYDLKPEIVKIDKGSLATKVDVIIVRNELSRNKFQSHNYYLLGLALKYLYLANKSRLKVKYIFTDINQTRFEWFVREHFHCSKTPYSARILAGYGKEVKSKTSFRLLISLLIDDYFKLRYQDFVAGMRIWLLANRYKYKRLFFVMRLIYKFLNRFSIV